MAGAGFVTVILPVDTVQVGWVGVAVGCAGTVGAAVIITLRAGDIQPALFCTVTL